MLSERPVTVAGVNVSRDVQYLIASTGPTPGEPHGNEMWLKDLPVVVDARFQPSEHHIRLGIWGRAIGFDTRRLIGWIGTVNMGTGDALREMSCIWPIVILVGCIAKVYFHVPRSYNTRMNW